MSVRVRQIFKRQDSTSFPPNGDSPTLASAPTLSSGQDEISAHPLQEDDEKLDEKLRDDRSHDHWPERGGDLPDDPSALDTADLDPANRTATGKERPIETDEDFGTRLISTVDDVDMRVHTIRMYVIGLGLTCFAAVLGQIFYFRPSSLTVSAMFILVLADILGRLWYMILPKGERWIWLTGRGAFNIKEHAAVLIMCTTAFSSAKAISVFAADELYYGVNPNYGNAIFTLIGSQFLGYGIAGLMRAVTVYPSYALWPSTLPTVQLLSLLHNDKDVAGQRKRMKFFLLVAIGIFVWEWFPEFIAPFLAGISVVCLARKDSPWVTRIFGGSSSNEGMGFFSICLDWAYLSGYGSLWTPLETQLSLFFGIGLSGILLLCAYAGNVWNAQNFPFMSQSLFYENGTEYDQMAILNDDYSLNRTLLEQQGLPWYSTSMSIYYMGKNLAIGATIMHCLLWYGPGVKTAVLAHRTRSVDDPHYRAMKAYKEVPMWVYGGILLASFAMALATCYTTDSQLPWYGVLVAFIISIVLFPFIALFPAVSGWTIDIETLVLMLASAVKPNPQATMYFVLYGSNSSSQGIAFAADLKLAQYIKLPPRSTLWVQSLGTVVGGIIQIIIAKQILGARREILLDLGGDMIWSGQNIQSFNSQAITWGALAKDMYGPDKTYAFVPLAVIAGFGVPLPFWLLHRYYPKLRLNLIITPMLCYTLGYEAAGINSGHFVAFLTAITSQFFLRKYRPTWFRKYNYIMSAALDTGMQVFVFIATFALFGAGNGESVSFPGWALNPQSGNADYCFDTNSA